MQCFFPFFYRIIDLVFDSDGQKVHSYFRCTNCQLVLFCDPGKGTKPLNSHADRCEAGQSIGSVAKKRKSGLYYVFSFFHLQN